MPGGGPDDSLAPRPGTQEGSSGSASPTADRTLGETEMDAAQSAEFGSSVPLQPSATDAAQPAEFGSSVPLPPSATDAAQSADFRSSVPLPPSATDAQLPGPPAPPNGWIGAPDPAHTPVTRDDDAELTAGVPRKTFWMIIGGAVAVFFFGFLALELTSDGEDEVGDEAAPLTLGSDAEEVAAFVIPDLPAGVDSFDEPVLVPPEDWDPVVADLVPFVEESRRLRFTEPVTVELLTGAELSAGFAIPDDPFLAEYLAAVVGNYRALGLLQGDVNLIDQINRSTDLGLMGLYDPTFDVIQVRSDVGGEPGASPFQRAVLVHELTHALQDQHADLSRPRFDQEEVDMQRLVVEGDARRIERAYVDSLEPDEQAQYNDTIAGVENQAIEAGLLGVLGVESAVVYEGGSQITRVVDTLDGSEAVDVMMRWPTGSPARLLRASTLFLHGQEPWAADGSDAEFPDFPPEAFPIDGGSQGAWLWYVTFATRIDPADALRAADAIGSDSYVIYEQNGQICSRHELAADGPHEAGHLAFGLRSWATALPHGAEVETGDTTMTVTVCDPGAAADPAFVNSPDDVIDAPIARIAAVADVLDPQRGWWATEKLKERERWCLAETTQRSIGLDEALEGLPTERIEELGEAAVRACLPERVGGGRGIWEGDCSADGVTPEFDDTGLPEAVAAARQAITDAAAQCDYAGLSAVFAESGAFFGDGNAPPPDLGRVLVDRWERRERQDQVVLSDLVSTLGSGWLCGPDVATVVEGREGGGCAWVWSGDGAVDSRASVVIVTSDGEWLGWGEHVDVQSDLMAFWSSTVTGGTAVDTYEWTGKGENDGLPAGWPVSVAPAAHLAADR